MPTRGAAKDAMARLALCPEEMDVTSQDDEELVRELVKTEPDLTLADLCQRVAAQTGKRRTKRSGKSLQISRAIFAES